MRNSAIYVEECSVARDPAGTGVNAAYIGLLGVAPRGMDADAELDSGADADPDDDAESDGDADAESDAALLPHRGLLACAAP